jgi:hypothetical protein
LAALRTLVGWFALFFHLLFCVAAAGLGALAIGFGPQSMHLAMFPWTDATLAHILLFGGFFGLLSVLLAAMGKLRFLFLFWSLAVASVLLNHFLFSSYRFAPGEWRPAAYLALAACLAVLGALFLMFDKPGPGPRKYRVK